MLGKVTKFLVEKFFISKLINQKPHGVGKHPPVPSGLTCDEPHARFQEVK